MASEWTRKLTKRQLEQIKQDTIAKEPNYPEKIEQNHIFKDIEAELKEREEANNGS
jgi:hypothetical protein